MKTLSHLINIRLLNLKKNKHNFNYNGYSLKRGVSDDY